MSRITGELRISFDTNKDVTKEQFEKFKAELDDDARSYSFLMSKSAQNCGFDTDESDYSIVLMDLQLDEPEEL